jgi:hypothetical protein
VASRAGPPNARRKNREPSGHHRSASPCARCVACHAASCARVTSSQTHSISRMLPSCQPPSRRRPKAVATLEARPALCVPEPEESRAANSFCSDCSDAAPSHDRPVAVCRSTAMTHRPREVSTHEPRPQTRLSTRVRLLAPTRDMQGSAHENGLTQRTLAQLERNVLEFMQCNERP